MAKYASIGGREFLKDTVRLQFDFSTTDQSRGIEPPPLEKQPPQGAERIALPRRNEWKPIPSIGLFEAMSRRRSRRNFCAQSLSLEELGFLLWATQGVQRTFGNETTFRPVPSAGGRHALETYLAVFRVHGLPEGLYRYLPLEHQLVTERSPAHFKEKLVEALLGQAFVAAAAVTFIWTAVPYRMEWRYGPASHKVIALDAGHVCQNLYLACEAVGCGTCAIAAYHQQLLDELLGVDGEDEFVVYVAPVGKVKRR